MGRIGAVLLLLVTAAGLGGCYPAYTRPVVACRTVYVPGHRGAWGRWHPGYYRCL
jgi:hypothetical protein